MTMFLAFVLLVLAGTMVLFFAMLGQLAARLPEQSNEPTAQVEPLENARLGAESLNWPAELAHLRDRERALVLVLSSSCASCEQIAAQVPDALDRGVDFGVVVSCGVRERGEDFIRRHELERAKPYLDHGGAWSTGEFNVDSSPAALLFRNGRLETALLFWTLDSALAATGHLHSAHSAQEA
ncbi:hypothetical protein OOJ91_14150 [Micromonospora lupini]|uniref:hypothetical protein n=1 Tax=Micromonospora lupini TaxID=285679 RepID=UPI0022565620|nr:hypothetical protein [Micromonospora lupini]MCX5066989.1 hypothetical protein [Micromonospora lupini]